MPTICKMQSLKEQLKGYRSYHISQRCELPAGQVSGHNALQPGSAGHAEAL